MNKSRESREKTALISILRNWKEREDPTSYSVQFFFLGDTLLPPFLPRVDTKFPKGRHKKILENLDKLAKDYRDSFLDDFRFSEEEGKEIRDHILRGIGWEIGHILLGQVFESIRKFIDKMNVAYIIFETDDYMIPWSWMSYEVPDEQLKGRSLDNLDFLANRYCCGTLIVNRKEDIHLPKELEKFERILVPRPTSSGGRQLNVCLLQGVLGEEASRKQRTRTYIEHLEDIFDGEDYSVSIYTEKDWKKYSGQQFIQELSNKIRFADIIHFSGQIDNGCLTFDQDKRVTPKELSQYLEFKRNPLVVLHGCSSGRLADLENPYRQLPAALLEKGAKGCLVALLPVDQPIILDDSPQSMITRFYHLAVKEEGSDGKMPFGKALIKARRDFQRDERTRYNPNWLFFKLYGDPRARLKQPRRPGLMEMIQRLDSAHVSKPPVETTEVISRVPDEVQPSTRDSKRTATPKTTKRRPSKPVKKIEKETTRDLVFISYSHKDKKWFEELKTHLTPYVEHKDMKVWEDTKIRKGTKWRQEIEKALASAKVAVLLVTPEFLASKFIAQEELPPLLAAAENEGLTILWVAVRSSGYETTGIKEYQSTNDPKKPLDSMSKPARHKAYVEICKEIMKAVDSS